MLGWNRVREPLRCLKADTTQGLYRLFHGRLGLVGMFFRQSNWRSTRENLRRWHNLPIPPDRWAAWLNNPAPLKPGFQAVSADGDADAGALVTLCGSSFEAWSAHLWLARLPLPALTLRQVRWLDEHPNHLELACQDGCGNAVAKDQRRYCLNLELPEAPFAHEWWRHLAIQDAIWDPDPARAALLQALGLPCTWLSPQAKPNGWLRWDHLGPTAALASSALGLPPPMPCHVLCLGLGDTTWEQALGAWETSNPQQILVYLPELPALAHPQPEEARALAAWLQRSAELAKQTVLLSDQGFCREPALVSLSPGPLRHLPPPITPSELVAELAGVPIAVAVDPLPPSVQMIWSHDSGLPVQAAVVISSFNYADRILQALDSVAQQTQEGLEVVVVDDASSDDSVAVLTAWLEAHPCRFARALLLRHDNNSGLAAARNTGFSHCRAAWCFVLDADNTLMPQAVAACLQLAMAAPAQMAVVHPLVEIRGARRLDAASATLISRVPWQREAFLGGNFIDAMALVRRQAWQAVGGYTHISGGWEDFDFWCKLIEAGYHGVLCPRVLARYQAHDGSMTATATSRQWRPLSRCLQSRHPWLRLPYAFEPARTVGPADHHA